MHPRLAAFIVFASSAAVLVVEIAAGRLMAPYVGVSLETFTGIISVVLAGIAAGAALGGRLADHLNPASLLAPALGVGGIFVWLSVPIVTALGPQLGSGAVAIVMLAAFGFLVPAIVLSAITPIVAKMQLSDLGETGSVFGGLSAAGTVGALLGSFLTGFVLVAAIGTRAILFLVGALLVLGAVAMHWWVSRSKKGRPMSATNAAQAGVVVALAALSTYALSPACQVETRYSCANVEVDPDDPSLVSLYLDGAHHARVDLDDPEHLEFRYIRLFGAVTDATAERAVAAGGDGSLDVLHIGGGGFTMPTYLASAWPGSTGHVLEIDPGVVDLARDHLGFVQDELISVDVGDARTALTDLPDDSYDLIIGDAFAGQSVPWHLTTTEVAAELDRLMRPGGIYVVNVIDGPPNGFAKAEINTLAEHFGHIEVVVPEPDFVTSNARGAWNQVIIASNEPLPGIVFDPADGTLLSESETAAYSGDAQLLTDDFAPVDQLDAN